MRWIKKWLFWLKEWLVMALGVVFIIAIPIGIVVGVVKDLMHPEKWDEHWLYDPRRYGPYLAGQLVILGIGCCFFRHQWRLGRKEEMKRKLLDKAHECADAGRLEEALEWRDRYYRT